MSDYLADLSMDYEHPYIQVIIQDNTVQYNESTTAVETRDFNAMQVGFFPDGRNGKLLYYTGVNAALNELGNPNFKTHGQAGYNVVNALSTNKCGMYIMGLMPDDATIANVVWMARVKVVSGGTTLLPGGDSDENMDGISTLDAGSKEEDVRAKLEVAFSATHITGATTEAELRTKFAALYTKDIDDEGYITFPLMMFWKLGSGKCGNTTRIRMFDATDYDYEPKHHKYQIQVAQPTQVGLAIVEKKIGVFDETAIDLNSTENPSMFIEDVINDLEYGSNKINMAFDMDSYEAILGMYNSVSTTQMTVSELDIVFGKLLSGMEDDNIIINDDGSGAGIFTVEGLSLGEGTDGSLDGPNAEEVKTNLLIAAYNGDIDPRIKSRFSTPADINLDAGYDDDVKRSMAGLATRRMWDLMTYLDTGLLETNAEVINWGRNMSNVYGYNVVKESGCYKYRDLKFTGKIIPMTITHYLAKAIPNHMAIYGLTEPFAKELARLSSRPVTNQPSASRLELESPDFVKGTFRPIIDPDMDDIKKEYYKYRINCYETVDFYTVQRSSAITTCRENCDRLLEFNEFIVHGAVKIAYAILASKIYKLGEEADRSRYEKHAQQEINHKYGSVVKSCGVKFIMTASDKKKRLMRLQLSLVMKTVITNGAVIVILNPNVDDVGVNINGAVGVSSADSDI